MTVKLGLTGNMGMGKSTAAATFAHLGCLVWDADARVHALYAKGGAAVPAIADHFTNVIVEGAVDRARLKAHLREHPDDLPMLETIVHGLLQQDRAEFLRQNPAALTIFDIPLLFEKNLDQEMDVTACVYVDPVEQRRRIEKRGTMSAQDIDFYLSKQMPIDQKLARADFQIDTSSLETMRRDVTSILSKLTQTHR